MKLIYMGTPPFAVPPFESLISAGHDLAAIVTRIDKPAGRGKTITQPAVKLAAQVHRITVLQPRRVREPEFIEVLRSYQPDAIIVAAYGQILPTSILTLPKLGCINIHASLLPSYRGAAPINWAIINGEQQAGITIMQMDEGMDTGAILLQEAILVSPEDTAGTLTEKLSQLGSTMIVKALTLAGSGGLTPRTQDNSGATLAPLLKKTDGLIDWTGSANMIHNRIRGMNPWPGAYTFLDSRMIKILRSEAAGGSEEPGRLFQRDNNTLEAGTGSGMLRILDIQLEGKRPMSAGEFLRGQRGVAGKKFERPTEPRKA